MKKLLSLLSILFSLKSFSQQVDGRVYSNISSPIKWQHGWFDKTLYLPSDTLTSTKPALAVKGGKLLYTTGAAPWSEVTGGNAVVDSAIYSTIARVRKITDSLNALTNTALAGKQPLGSYAAVSHTHNIGDITGITTSVVPEGSNQYFTNARARSAISLSVTGISGAATYNNTTGALNIPTYTLTGLGGVPATRTITINGSTLDLSQDRSWTISVGGSGNWGSIGGTLSSQTDLQNALNAKEGTISSGTTSQYWRGDKTWQALPVYTLSGLGGEPAITAGTTGQYWRGDKTWQTLPVYTLSGLGGVPTSRTITINGTPFDLSADRTWTVSGLPSGGTNGQVVMLNGSTPEWADIGFPPTAVSDVTGLQDSLNVVRNASVPTSRTITINGTAFDLTANRSWTVSGSAAWGSITGNLADQSDLQAILESKAPNPSRSSMIILETDFLTTTSPFSQGLTGAAVSSGTIVQIAAEPNHPGIVELRDATTANGGYRILTDVLAFRLSGGEKFVGVFQMRGVRSTAVCRLGYQDQTSATAPVDGVYIDIVGNGTTLTATGRCRNNNTETATGTTFAPATNTWYACIIELNSDATSATFTIYNESGVEQWTQTVTTNIPTASGRETGAGIYVGESTTDAAAGIIRMDYLRIEKNKTLIR